MVDRVNLKTQAFFQPLLELRVLRVDAVSEDANRCTTVNLL